MNDQKKINRRALQRPQQPIIDALCTLLGDRDVPWEFVDTFDLDLGLTLDEEEREAGVWSHVDVVAFGQAPGRNRRFTLRHRTGRRRKCSVGRVARQIYKWAQPAAARGFGVGARVRFIGEPLEGRSEPPSGEVGEVVKLWPYDDAVEVLFPSVSINHWFGVVELELVAQNENPRQGGHPGGGSREGMNSTRESGRPAHTEEDTR